jgi:hypothetical protein
VSRQLIGAAVLVCAGMAVAALVIGGVPDEGVPHGTAQSGLAILEAPAAEGDALPSQVVAALAASVHHEFTPQDLRQARRVLADQPAWLVPASDGETCLVQVLYPRVQTGDVEPLVVPTCASQAGIEAGELVEVESHSASGAQPEARVVGIVPDGVTAVNVEAIGHRLTRVPVMRNAFEAIVGDPTQAWFVRRTGDRLRVERFPLAGIPGKSVTRPPVSVRGEVF